MAAVAVDKEKLDTATSAATASALASRDANGAMSVGTPTATTHATTKDYVDGKKWSGADITSGTVPVARLPLVTTVANGAMLAADKVKLDTLAAKGTWVNIPLSNGAASFGGYAPQYRISGDEIEFRGNLRTVGGVTFADAGTIPEAFRGYNDKVAVISQNGDPSIHASLGIGYDGSLTAQGATQTGVGYFQLRNAKFGIDGW